MSNTVIGLIIAGAYIIIAFLVIIVYMFISPEDDLCDMCGLGLAWPIALVVLVILFIPYKLLEMLQNKLLERRAKKKYYDEDEYRYENEDWHSEE